jgi:hypothetical protein
LKIKKKSNKINISKKVLWNQYTDQIFPELKGKDKEDKFKKCKTNGARNTKALFILHSIKDIWWNQDSIQDKCIIKWEGNLNCLEGLKYIRF